MKKVFFILVVLTSVLFIEKQARAQTLQYIGENFDSYSATSVIGGQGLWRASSTGIVVNNIYRSSPNSLASNADRIQSPQFTTTTIGFVSFDVYASSTPGGGANTISFGPNGSDYVNISCPPDGSQCSLSLQSGGASTPFFNFPQKQWGTIYYQMNFNSIDNNGSTTLYYYSSSTAFSVTSTVSSNNEYWHFLDFQTSVNSYFIDNFNFISYEQPLSVNENNGAPTINPVFPVECRYNTLNYQGTAFGTVSNPATSSISYYEIGMMAYDYWMDSFTFASTAISLAPGQTKNYSFYYNLPSGGLYQISYYMYGRDINTNSFYTFTHQCVQAGHIFTYVGEDASNTLELLECDLNILGEDCATTTLSLLEKFTCQVSETIRGTLIPSCSKRAELSRNFNQIKRHAPFNYVYAFSDFMADFILVEPGTSSATNSIFGSMVYMTDKIKTNTTTVYYLTIIRNIFKAILYIIFGIILIKIVIKLFH